MFNSNKISMSQRNILLRGVSILQRGNRAYFSEMNYKGSTKDINTNFFLFKDTSFQFESVFLQIFKHEFRDLGTSLNLSLPKTTWVSLLYHIDQLGYLKSKKWNIFWLRPVLAMIGRSEFFATSNWFKWCNIKLKF